MLSRRSVSRGVCLWRRRGAPTDAWFAGVATPASIAIVSAGNGDHAACGGSAGALRIERWTPTGCRFQLSDPLARSMIRHKPIAPE